MTRSTASVIAFLTASRPSRASTTPKPASASIVDSILTTRGLSSATRMRGVVTGGTSRLRLEVAYLIMPDWPGRKVKPRGSLFRIETNGDRSAGGVMTRRRKQVIAGVGAVVVLASVVAYN